MKRIKLTQGMIVLIDNDDHEKIKKYKWHFTHGYARCDIGNNKIYMHRLIMNSSAEIVDHINRNPLDNRKRNLRLATKRINALNSQKRSGTTSKYKGVSFHRQSKKWRAYRFLMGKQIHLGTFSSELKAYKERKKWEE